MSYFVVDIESDGPIPGVYSMVSFGVMKVDNDLNTGFKGLVKPVSDKWVSEALAISEITRQTHETYPEPVQTMTEFVTWLARNNQGHPVFWSDNPAFDWQFMNYYLHVYTGSNPFGFSARRIGDLYAGLNKNLNKANDWKKLRKTAHTHDPLDDAKGNAEALLEIARRYELKIPA